MFASPQVQFSRVRDPQQLQAIADQLRVSILKMIHRARSGHTGSSLSCIDLLVALYFAEMRHYPFEPEWPAGIGWC